MPMKRLTRKVSKSKRTGKSPKRAGKSPKRTGKSRKRTRKSRKRSRSRKDGANCASASTEEKVEEIAERVDDIDQIIGLLENVKIGTKHIPDNLSGTHKIGEPEYILREQLGKLIRKRDEFEKVLDQFKKHQKLLTKLKTKDEIEKAEKQEIMMSEYIANFDKELKDLCKKLRKDLDYAAKLYNLQLFQSDKNIALFQKDVEKMTLTQVKLNAEDPDYDAEFAQLVTRLYKTQKAVSKFVKYTECKKKIMKETIRPAIAIVEKFC